MQVKELNKGNFERNYRSGVNLTMSCQGHPTECWVSTQPITEANLNNSPSFGLRPPSPLQGGRKPSPLVGEGARRAGEGFSRAFTLIELLVVVLIIGILAAVALPQYQQAVMKSRFLQGIALCDAVYKAERVYYLANGTYTDQFADLDIDLTGVGTLAPAGNSISASGFSVALSMQDAYCRVSGGKRFPNYYFYMRGRKDCRVNADNALQHKVCLSLGGKLQSGQSFIYILPIGWAQ